MTVSFIPKLGRFWILQIVRGLYYLALWTSSIATQHTIISHEFQVVAVFSHFISNVREDSLGTLEHKVYTEHYTSLRLQIYEKHALTVFLRIGLFKTYHYHKSVLEIKSQNMPCSWFANYFLNYWKPRANWCMTLMYFNDYVIEGLVLVAVNKPLNSEKTWIKNA